MLIFRLGKSVLTSISFSIVPLHFLYESNAITLKLYDLGLHAHKKMNT